MEAKKQTKSVFLVLVPHRDVRCLLRKNCDEMIRAGLTGVYSFPQVAPIAELSEEFSGDELKIAAHYLRIVTGGEKMYIKETSSAAFPLYDDNMTLFGRHLDIIISPDILDKGIKKVKRIFSNFLIGSWLIPGVCEQQLKAGNSVTGSALALLREKYEGNRKIDFFPQEKLSFRAAAVANMYLRSFQAGDDIGYKWKIGKLLWLPNKTLRVV